MSAYQPSFFKNSCTAFSQNSDRYFCEALKIIANVGQDGWSRSLQYLPTLTERIIDDHLINKSDLMPDKRKAQAHKHKQKGYELFKEACAKKIEVKRDIRAGDTTLFLVRAKVHASMKDQEYSVYIRLVQENGDMHAASCTCKSGKGSCCEHVASLLFT